MARAVWGIDDFYDLDFFTRQELLSGYSRRIEWEARTLASALSRIWSGSSSSQGSTEVHSDILLGQLGLL